MQIRRSILIFPVISLLSACAGFNGNQPPAPVFGGPAYDPYQRFPREQNPVIQQPPPVLETKPLEGFNKTPEIVEIKPDFAPPADNSIIQPNTEQATPLDQPTDPFGTEQPADDQAMPETEPPAEEPKPIETVKPVAPPLPVVPKEPEALETLETFAPQSPAVGSLVMAANENTQSGNIDSAVSSIERAIRIEPRNATLYYKLAVLRLKQSKPKLAEDLARKAAILAVNDNALKKHSWLLIANARELQNNIEGAKKAKMEAAKY
ncbi:MAG: hypothetical protein IPN42_13120 [Methylococcaceae bacterium]|nr:hypothetical protein [Methylococcaceae bacterium]